MDMEKKEEEKRLLYACMYYNTKGSLIFTLVSRFVQWLCTVTYLYSAPEGWPAQTDISSALFIMV